MTHVSKYPMRARTEKRIRQNLMSAALSSSENRNRTILESLLTKTEKTMLAKRLAIIVMLEQEYSYYRICKTLAVSVSTPRRIHRQLLAGRFNPILREMKRKRSRSLLDELELLLAAGMPSIAGPRYQKRLRLLRENR